MLDSNSIDLIFEKVWAQVTKRGIIGLENIYGYCLYPELANAASVRDDRKILTVEDCRPSLEAVLGKDAVKTTELGCEMTLPDDTFSLIRTSVGWLRLKSGRYPWRQDVYQWKPEEIALFVARAGHFREWCGERWDGYFAKVEEQRRVDRIRSNYRKEKREILDQYADYLLIEARKKVGLEDPYAGLFKHQEYNPEELEARYRDVLEREDEEVGSRDIESLQERIAQMKVEAEKKAQEDLRREQRSARAKKQYAERKEERQRKNEEAIQRLTERLGVAPTITRRYPPYGSHYDDYGFPLSNGQTVSFKDYKKDPDRIAVVAEKLLPLFEGLVPFATSKFAVKGSLAGATQGMVEYWKKRLLETLPPDSPLLPVITRLLDECKTLMFEVKTRVIEVRYYFKKGGDNAFLFSIPRVFSAEDAASFGAALTEFIKADKALRRSALEYGFDKPLKLEKGSK